MNYEDTERETAEIKRIQDDTLPTKYVKECSMLNEAVYEDIEFDEYKALKANGYTDQEREVREGTIYITIDSDDVLCGLCAVQLTDAEIAHAACHQACLDNHNSEEEE